MTILVRDTRSCSALEVDIGSSSETATAVGSTPSTEGLPDVHNLIVVAAMVYNLLLHLAGVNHVHQLWGQELDLSTIPWNFSYVHQYINMPLTIKVCFGNSFVIMLGNYLQLETFLSD